STPERSFALETWAPSGHCSLKLCLFATVLLIVLSCPLLQSYRRVYTACFADARERAEKSRVLRWAAPRTRTRSADGWWLAHAHPWPSPARPQAGKGRGRGHRRDEYRSGAARWSESPTSTPTGRRGWPPTKILFDRTTALQQAAKEESSAACYLNVVSLPGSGKVRASARHLREILKAGCQRRPGRSAGRKDVHR